MSPSRGRMGGAGGVPKGVKADSGLSESCGVGGRSSFIIGRGRPCRSYVVDPNQQRRVMRHLITNAWIEIAVSNVYEQIHHQKRHGNESHDAENQWFITIERCLD